MDNSNCPSGKATREAEEPTTPKKSRGHYRKGYTMAMFIAIFDEDFLTFADNNNATQSYDFAKQTEHPIFTGATIEETRDHIENYLRTCLTIDDDIPEYEICEISTVAIVKAAYKFDISCDYTNPAAE